MDLETSNFSIIKFRLGAPFDVTFTLQNMSDKTIAANTLVLSIPPQGKAGTIIRSVAPIASAIPAYGEITCTATVKTNGKQPFRKYPMLLTIEIQAAKKVVHTASIQLPAALIASNVKQLVLPASRKRLNILVFGEFGAGKTSLMLTILSALKGSLVMAHPQLGVIGGGQGHASTTYRRIDVTPKISFLDSWGCSPTNYANDEFRQIITGKFPLGTEMDTKLKYTQLNDGATSDQLQPDAVFFFITQALVEDSSYMERLKKFKSILQTDRPEINPYIILSKIDEIDPKLRGNPDINDDLVQDKIIRVSAETGVPEMHIFPVLSYKIERESSEVIDRFALDLLNTAIEGATQLHKFEW